MASKIRITGISVIVVILISMFVAMGVVQSRNVGDVKKVVCTQSDVSSANLEWKGVSGADGYYVYKMAKGEKEYSTAADIKESKGNTISVKVEKLEQATEYSFCIAAYKKDGKYIGEKSDIIKTCTIPAKQTLKLTSPDALQMKMEWELNEKAAGYKVEYIKGDGSDFNGAQTIDITDCNENTKLLEELIANDRFAVRVCSYIKYNGEILAGEWSDVKTVEITEKQEMPKDIDPNKPMIALTFDDGPGYNKASDKILDVLEKYNARATFFMVGRNAADHPKNVKRKVELGCEIGNHTYDHNHYGKSVTVSDIKKASQAIEKAGGVYPTAFRSPGGNTTSEIRKECKVENMPLYYWSLDTQDWKYRDADKIYNKVMKNVEDGDIILMHEIYDSTAQAVEKMVPQLIKKGYQLVTCEELIKYKSGKKPVAGQQYVDASTVNNKTS